MNAAAKKTSSTILEWTEQGRVPDAVIRAGIRRLCRQRLRDIEANNIEASARRLENFIRLMDAGPVALVRRTPIAADDDCGTLGDRLASLAAQAVVEAVDRAAAASAWC